MQNKSLTFLLYLGKQGLSLRGHNETTSSSNRGNFLELCDWYAKRDKIFCQLYNSPRNLTSPSIQNELIEIAAFQVQNEILKRIIENGFYTILVDETRSFKQEQMIIYVRFVNALDLNVEERFVAFVNCSRKADAVAINTLASNFSCRSVEFTNYRLWRKDTMVLLSCPEAKMKFNQRYEKIFHRQVVYTAWLIS